VAQEYASASGNIRMFFQMDFVALYNKHQAIITITDSTAYNDFLLA
jgi:hypothetical protein